MNTKRLSQKAFERMLDVIFNDTNAPKVDYSQIKKSWLE